MKKISVSPPCPFPTKEETPHETIVRLLNGPHPGHLVNPKAVLAVLNNTK